MSMLDHFRFETELCQPRNGENYEAIERDLSILISKIQVAMVTTGIVRHHRRGSGQGNQRKTKNGTVVTLRLHGCQSQFPSKASVTAGHTAGDCVGPGMKQSASIRCRFGAPQSLNLVVIGRFVSYLHI